MLKMTVFSVIAYLPLFFASAASASDKGLKAEMREASVTIFCTTAIAQDLKPIVRDKRMMMRAKMSQEALKRLQAKHDVQWRAISAKYAHDPAKLGLTPRWGAVSSDYVKVAADEAWTEIRRRCRKSAKDPDLDADYVFEFLIRRIASKD